VPSRDDDRSLVEAFLRCRDEQSFVAIYRAHTPALYRMAWRMGGLGPDVVDAVVQDTWVRAARRFETFRFESALRTWLISILVFCVQERRRQHARAAGRLDPPGPEPSVAVAPELALDLERAVARLPHGMREVFLLHDVEGLTHEEIGTCLGIASGTSKSQLSTARARLRHWLGGSDHGA
jgi:RNA polymerase sigma-70 factor (ECF subfamily)